MHAIILAGGKGLRLLEYTHHTSKALIDIGGKPIVEFIIHHLARDGFDQITIAGGYQVDKLKQFAENTRFINTTVDVVDTGLNTNTGGRIKRLEEHIQNQPFLLCCCDALSDVDFKAFWNFHNNQFCRTTIGVVHPPSRFVEIVLDGDVVTGFIEKPEQQGRWISGGYFVVEPDVLELIDGDGDSWERDIVPRLVKQRTVSAFQYHGYWQCMDIVHERNLLNDLQLSGRAPWPQHDPG